MTESSVPAEQRRIDELESSLNEVEERWRTLIDNVADFVLLVDRQGKIEFINRTRPHRSNVVGTDSLQYIEPEYQARLKQAIEDVFTTGEVSQHQVQETDVGSWFDVRLAPIREGEEVVKVLAICTDTTERKQAELRLQHAHDELEDRVEERTHELRAINQLLREQQTRLRNLLDMQNRDRLLIAFEIHDGMVQYMTAAQLFLEGGRGALPDQDVEAFDKGLEMLRKAIDEARRLIGGLRPPILEGEGLESALRGLVEEFEGLHGFEVDFAWDCHFSRLAPALETAVYRAVQEGLNNVDQHAGVKAVELAVRQADDRVYVLIRDEGKGFDPDQVDKKRHGLFGIRERADVLEGTAEILSRPGQGTTIRLDLPLIVSR